MALHTGTTAIARRSLAQFALGRSLSALLGLLSLLLLVRSLGREDYGIYIALMAALEIAQIAVSPGAYAVVFRFLPELRAAAPGSALGRLVVAVTAYGFATMLLAALGLAAGAQAAADLLGLPQHAPAVRVFALVMLFEGTARLVDTQFESLLEQGRAQLSALARNSVRLGALAWIGDFGRREIAVADWMAAEAASTAFGMVVSLVLMAHYLRRPEPAPAQVHGAAGKAARGIPFARLWRFAAPSWVAHLLGIASNVEMAKLLVGKFDGPAAVAAFGFAANVASLLQRFLPGVLLLGWVRPLLIAARESGQPVDLLVERVGTVVKLNLLAIAPLATLVAVAGTPLVEVLAGGRLPDSLPFVAFFVALLVLQTLRAAVALLGVTLELGMASLRATLASLAGLALGVAAHGTLGSWALCLGLVVSEALSTLVMLQALHAAGLRFVWPTRATARLAASVVLAAGAGQVALSMWPLLAARPVAALALGLGSALLALAIAARLRPFTAAERELVNRLLPWRLFVW